MPEETKGSQPQAERLVGGLNTVEVVVDPNVKRDDLHAILDKIVAGLIIPQNGCTTCGLGGFDVRFRTIDPQILEQFRDIPAVRDIVVNRSR